MNRIYREQEPIGWLAFIKEYKGSNTNRIVRRVILDGNIEIEHPLINSDLPLRTELVHNDVIPVENSTDFTAIMNISLRRSRTVTLKLEGEYNGTIVWGNGVEQIIEGNKPVTIEYRYDKDEAYFFKLIGKFTSVQIMSDALISIRSFGENQTNKYSFTNCKYLTKIPKKLPSSVTNLDYAFGNCDNLDLSNLSEWDLSNVESMVAMLANTTGKTLTLTNITNDKLKDISSLFQGAINPELNLVNVNLTNLSKIDSLFKDAERPRFKLINSQLPSLRNITDLVALSFTAGEEKGNIQIDSVSLGLDTLDSLFSNFANTDIKVTNLVLPRATVVKKLVSDCSGCNVDIESIYVRPNTVVSNLIGFMEGNSIDHKNTVNIGSDVLKTVNNFDKLIADTKNMIVNLTFNEDVRDAIILSNMIYSVENSEININTLKSLYIDFSQFITNSFDSKITFSCHVTVLDNKPVIFKNVVTDSNKVELRVEKLDILGSLIMEDVAHNSIDFYLNVRDVIVSKNFTVIKLLDELSRCSLLVMKAKVYGDTYIDSIINDSSFNILTLINFELLGDVNIGNLLNKAVNNDSRIPIFETWTIGKNLNTRLAEVSSGKYLSGEVKLLTQCTLSRGISFNTWRVGNEANLKEAFSQLSAVSKITMNGWRVNSININGLFKGTNVDIEMNSWKFGAAVTLFETFADIYSPDSKVSFKSSTFSSDVNYISTFSGSSVNVDISIPSFGNTVNMVDTFLNFGSTSEFPGIEISIIGLNSWSTTNINSIIRFMSYVGRKIPVNGLQMLINWDVSNVINIQEPFRGTILSFEHPF